MKAGSSRPWRNGANGSAPSPGRWATLSQSEKEKKIEKNKPQEKQEKPKIISMKKLSYNQQRLLQVLPAQIEEIENKIANITNELADADLYQNNREKFFALSDELKELENQKSEAENQWLEISILAEEITSAN